VFSKLIWCTGPKKQLLCKKISKILSLLSLMEVKKVFHNCSKGNPLMTSYYLKTDVTLVLVQVEMQTQVISLPSIVCSILRIKKDDVT